ncbi:MAG: MFS transporter family glucose-6-phosphate receptor UhpC [Coxiellaceae bacterium]|jgi:OPA family sugar phosphate sensor protein UhpC-like MFS transporter|nr:MFS transporter family glucose-6-phosphate receptor UhpC [Coxiellaceae bacterium]
MANLNYRNFLKKPVIEKITDPAIIDQTYRYWRIRTLYSMYIGYAAFYLTRKSFTFIIPQMIRDLHFTKEQIGILGSVFYITYGISKFISGMISDKANPRYFMVIGLIATGITNIFFGLSSSLSYLIFFWLINGFFQGWGWPPCARLLTHWYSQSERGRWWGAWNTAHNLGGAMIPIITAISVILFANWRAAMFVPGIATIIISLFIFNRLRDIPESQGLPPIEAYHNEYTQNYSEKFINQSITSMFLNYVFKNYYIWLLGFSYVFVYVVRTAINDWGSPFLTEQGYTLMRANSCMSFFEIGGLIGSLVAGWCSDKFFKGLRGQTNVLFSLGVVILLLCFWFIPGEHLVLHSAIMFGIGFFVFGPQMLIGMVAAELSHKEVAGTASGFVGLFGYLGAAMSGYPIGLTIDHYSWSGFFIIITVCAILSILLLIPLWKVSGYKQIFKNQV